MAFGGFRFAGLEAKNILGSAGAKALLVALVLIPCVCAAFFLASFSNPYKASTEVPVAIVNLDEGATVNGEERNVGEEVCDDIASRSDGLQWNFVSADEAQAGMEAGKYYMVCTIPADFSDRIASADTGDPKAASLGIEYNESKNAAASQMGRSAWQAIQNQVSDSVTRQYWNTMLTRTSDAGKSMEESAAGAQQLAEGMSAVEQGNDAIAQGISGIGQGAAALQSGLGTMATMGDALGQGASALSSSGSMLDAGVQALATGTQALTAPAFALDQAAAPLASGVQALDEGLQATVEGIGSSDEEADPENPTLASTSQSVTAFAQAMGEGLTQMGDGLSGVSENAFAVMKEQVAATKAGLGDAATELERIATNASADQSAQQTDENIAAAQGYAQSAETAAQEAQANVDAAQEAMANGVQANVGSAQAALESLRASDSLSDADKQLVQQAIDSLAVAGGSLEAANTSLANAETSLATVQAEAGSAASAIDGIAAITPAGVADQVQAVAATLKDLSENTVGAETDAALTDVNDSNAVKTLYAAANGIEEGLTEAQKQAGELAQTNSMLVAASRGTTMGIDAVSQGLAATQQGAAQLSEGASALASATPLLSQGISQLDQGTQSVATGVSAYVSGASVLAESLPAFAQGISTIASSTGALVSGADALAQASGQMGEGMTMVAEGNQSLADQLTEDSEGLRMPKAEIDDKAEMMATPVELDESYYTHADSYAASIAPYFLAICLWVGSLVASFILRPFDRRLAASGANPVATAFAGFVPFALVAIVQAAVMMLVVQFLMGVPVENAPQFYAFGLLAALAFAAIMQLFSAAFGLGGRLAAVVLLALQAACVAGVFPIETMGGLFQALGALMPMTYAVEGMRQIMMGVGFGVAATAACVLAAFLLACFALTALAVWRKRMVRMTDLHPALQAVR